ncbi:hypothetical protein Cni_G16980 [Canna indica]|uniref:CCHC-type domain-containing protein n=1 Tax=Canna indica TaxID=4628 RepID=A0AAQ3KJU4_9LILI|nr:hypothetical protein Cni_G16980 [Canna indica]
MGQPIKVDEVTNRGLMAKIRQSIAFENIPKLCYGCRKLGHLAESCFETIKSNEAISKSTDNDEEGILKVSNDTGADSKEESKDSEIYGPWQLVSSKRRNGAKKNDSLKSKSVVQHEKRVIQISTLFWIM